MLVNELDAAPSSCCFTCLPVPSKQVCQLLIQGWSDVWGSCCQHVSGFRSSLSPLLASCKRPVHRKGALPSQLSPEVVFFVGEKLPEEIVGQFDAVSNKGDNNFLFCIILL